MLEVTRYGKKGKKSVVFFFNTYMAACLADEVDYWEKSKEQVWKAKD